MDREKVIDGLRHCLPETIIDGLQDCNTCPYQRDCETDASVSMPIRMIEDVRSLLKEQKEQIDTLKENFAHLSAMIAVQQEIVRCKDCKWRSYYCTEATDGTTMYTCHYPCANDVSRPADWFCADGERKEGR